MIAIGLILLWTSYTLLLYGWTRLKSMPVGILDLIIPGHYDACRWAQDVEQGKDNKSTGCIQSGTGSGSDVGGAPVGSGKGTAGGMAQIALSQVGIGENGGRYCTKYGAWYGMNCVQWCDIFVAWCANQNGTLSQVGKFAYTPSHAAWFKGKGQWHSGSGGAQPGDIMFFTHGGEGDMGGIYHVAIVVENADSAGNVKTVAGDTGGRDVAVERWSRSQVAGYGRPAYPGNQGGIAGGIGSGLGGIGGGQDQIRG